jgi:hypothetical protein
MNPSLRVRLSVALLVVVSMLGSVRMSLAQYSPLVIAARQSADLWLDNFARSPSLLGMGQLSLVGQDPHFRITMWDFAANPTGVLAAESTSTFDLRPNGGGASDVTGIAGTEPQQVRETFAAHAADLGYEGWRRAGHIAYGAIGTIGGITVNQPYSDDVEKRTQYGQPSIMPVINGIMPFTKSGRTRYSVDMHFAQESGSATYLSIVKNGAGEFISLDSELQLAPDIFVPDHFTVRQLGAGFGVSQVLASWLTAALGYDGINNRIDGDTQNNRNAAGSHESRPYNIGQASFIGHIGPNFTWGADGRGWTASSEQDWDFTISAGQGAAPLSGRGKKLERDEEGTSMRTRAMWKLGRFDLGAGWNTDYQKVTITPPDANDLTSFNYFLNTVFYRQNADSLALPDSVSHEIAEVHAWEVGGGAAIHLGKDRGLIGLEYHKAQQHAQTIDGGDGPERQYWDMRSGINWKLSPEMSVRGGYQYRWDDQDAFTKNNEYASELMTFGVGMSPKRSSWTIDLSYGVRWLQADYGAPGAPHGSRQMLASQIHWSF